MTGDLSFVNETGAAARFVMETTSRRGGRATVI